MHKDKNMKIIIMKFFTWFIFFSAVLVYSQHKQGLTGMLYDDTALTRISNIWNLESLDSDKANWPSKNDFSAQWKGFLKIPTDSEITFTVEADNEIQLIMNGQMILNTWDNAAIAEGKFSAKEGSLNPLTLRYRQISGKSYMRIFWSWEGHVKEIIPISAFSYDTEMENEFVAKFESIIPVKMDELDFDIASIIAIHSEQDVEAKCKALIKILWGKDGFPFGKLPDSVSNAISDSDFVSLKNLQRIDRLAVEMEAGFNSIVYHFIPEQENGSAAIYHQGHGGKFNIGISTIRAFLKRGYHVFAMSMPLLGMNRKPVVTTERFGKLIIHSHNQMILLEPKAGHPVKYFMEPVAVVTNYAQKFNFKQLIMTGLSGGGWTTTLYAAIDPRIDISYPVAGTLPHYLRARDFGGSGSMGDYEQRAAEIYRAANYLELYIMGSYGKNRHQLQILNEFDACCFRGTGYLTYLDSVRHRLLHLGQGSFNVFLDSTHRAHQISAEALNTIFNDLDEEQNAPE